MDKYGERFDSAQKKIAREHCYKILFIDFTEDRYEAAADENAVWETIEEGQSSKKISEWFLRFADSPFCHDHDREKFKAFTDLSALRTAFEKTDYQPVSIVYRSKFNLEEPLYRTVKMEILPSKEEDGHLTAFLFVKDITADIQSYHAGLDEEFSGSMRGTSKRTLLIVEDNEMNREILAELLGDEYQILQAENGALGLEVLQKNMMDIAVVILDVQMPVMNGYEFLKYVQKDPFLSKIPVIVATGSDNSEEERICLSLGATDFVEKPYNVDIIKSRISNIIRLKESAATMSILQTDDRTGLYTLQAFYYHVSQIIDKSAGQQYSVTVFDVEHFKYINDNYGEETGNRILQQIADVLRDYTAASDINTRFGAARFLLLSKKMSLQDTEIWIGGLFSALAQSCEIKGISFKVGIYDNIDTKLPVPAICDRAIIALNSIGTSFENCYAFYDEKHAEKEHRLAVLEADMRDAYENEEFAVYYQPKHDAGTGKLCGAEALIRWIHPKFGFLSPGEFIPLFESNGFISYADYYVLKRTCRNQRLWLEEGLSVVPISVNASRRDFDHDNFMETIMDTLHEKKIDPSLIHIEVTESLFTDKMDEISQILRQCREEGLLIELDDFGSGYSSLTTLTTLPLDVIKLDMSFMKNYKDDKKRKVLAACINLTKSLGLRTVSEGVETEDQLELLKEYGCDLIQGYYFSKPLPEKEFKEYLLKWGKLDAGNNR